MKPSFRSYVFAGLLVLGLLAGSGLPTMATAAARIAKYPTSFTLSPITSVELGQPFILSGYLKTSGGLPVPNKGILVTIDGNKLGQTRTNASGAFQRKFSDLINAGTHTITVSDDIARNYYGTTASTSLVVNPADVRIQTIPATPGLTFEINGQTIVSGADGVADVKIGYAGRYEVTAKVDKYSNPDQRIEFSRWVDNTFQPFTFIQVPSNQTIEVGLNVYEQVGESFVDLNGSPVNTARISQFTIRSAQGDTFVLKDGTPQWIPSSRIARRQAGLEATPLQYSVISVMVDGSNVVNASQQRFFAQPNGTWQISLILYSLTIHATDGLFGSTVGKSINLVYPDGKVLNYPYNLSGSVTINNLARGNYSVQVIGAKGLKQVIPVALSRSQTVEVKIPTSIDLIILFSLGLLVVLGLLVFGRRQLVMARARSIRAAYQQTQVAKAKLGNVQTPDGKGKLSNPEVIKWS
jgi:hypothetical protein